MLEEEFLDSFETRVFLHADEDAGVFSCYWHTVTGRHSRDVPREHPRLGKGTSYQADSS